MSVTTLLLLVFGGALAVEGIVWAIAPDMMRRSYEQMMASLDPQSLAKIGFLSAALGCLMIWLGVTLA